MFLDFLPVIVSPRPSHAESTIVFIRRSVSLRLSVDWFLPGLAYFVLRARAEFSRIVQACDTRLP